jgi:hypothetical protein
VANVVEVLEHWAAGRPLRAIAESPSGSLDSGVAKGVKDPVNLRGSLKQLP